MIRKSKGITLIALVITIIVLLILAGVTISMLTGENGILKQATNAKDTTDKSEFEEQVKLAVMASKTNDTGNINTSDLEMELNKINGAKITKSTNNELPWTVKKGSYETTITAEGTIISNTTGKDDNTKIDYGTKKPSEDTRTVIEQATAAKPEGSTIDSTTNENTGIVMIDSNKNEWVWVEVPATVFATATSNTDYDKIKADLIEYTKDYRNDKYVDEWYARDTTSQIITASTEGLTEEQKMMNNGCGLTFYEYNTNYNKMLSSIYTNKGFYVGRYEAGIFGSDTDISLARNENGKITNDSPKAVSKKDMIPYNNLNCKDSQQLANQMATGNKTSSLMFGIQWDLVCKFLEVKGDWDTSTNTAQYYIKENSISWGNFVDSGFIVNSANAKGYASQWGDASGMSKSAGIETLLTTGASEQNKKMNIYDFAGNQFEFTLEMTNTFYPYIFRGGAYNGDGVASDRGNNVTLESVLLGFRSALY